MWRRSVVLLSAVLVGGAGFQALAAEETPRRDEVVVTATMSEKRVADAPGSVEVITAQEMLDMNALTVAEALESAAGLAVSRESGRVQVPAIRGARGKHTLVLLDGRRLAPGFNDLVDLRQIPTVMVERIEIVRGPASALYGSDALGGVVNIITKRLPAALTGQIGGQYGLNRDGKAREYVGGGLVGGPLLTDRGRFLVAGELREKNGWDKSGSLPDDGFEEKPRFVAGRFAYDITDAQTLSGGAEYMENTYTGAQLYENVARERIGDEHRSGYYLQYDARPEDFQHLVLRLNRSEYRHDLDFHPYAISGDRRTEQVVNQGEARYTGLFLERHLLTLGGEWRREELDDRQAESGRTDEHVTNLSLFLQDEYQIVDPLLLVLALRYDHHSEFGRQWTPRVSLVYNLTDTLRLKAAYGRGFRAPSLTELFVTSLRRRGRDIYEANPDLKAEKSNTYEVGMEADFQKGYAGLTAFRSEVDNLIESVFERVEGSGSGARSYYVYRNIAEATLQGLEAQAGWRLPLGFSLDGHFTWLDVENKSAAEDIGGQPKYKAFVKLGYALPEWRLRANLRMNYTGRLTYADGDRKSYALYGLFVAKEVGRHTELFAGVDNLFDKRVERDNVVQIEPTTFYAGLSLKF